MQKEALGPMPKASVILLASLVTVWVILLAFYIRRRLRRDPFI